MVIGDAPRWEGSASRPHGGMSWRSCGAESAGAWQARGRAGAGVRGSPGRSGPAGPLWGPAPSGAPWRGGGGRKRGVRANPGERRWSPALRAKSGRWSCALWRGGGEAGERPRLLPPGVPRVTAAAAILPHTDPPPAPADSGVRRHCARGGASQLRGWGSGREPGVSTCRALGGALAGATRLPGLRARRRDGLPGTPRRGGRAEGQDAGSRRRKLRRLT